MHAMETSTRLTKLVRSTPLILVIILYFSQLKSAGTHNMSYYVLWAKSIVGGNLFDIYHATPQSFSQNSDSLTVPYTPLSQYLIAGIAWLILRILSNTRETYILAINLTCVSFTFLTAILYFHSRKALNLNNPITYLLTPAVFLVSPILAYEDSIMSFFIVATLIALNRDKYLLGGLLAGCAVFSKQLALMPIVAICLLLIFSKRFYPFVRFSIGGLISSAIILAPFILTGNILWYFKAQSLTSVHTMASAQAANFPWLGSLIYRISTVGFLEGLNQGGNGLRISSDSLRQVGYLASGILTLSIFLMWAIYWGRRSGAQNLDLPLGVTVMIFSYHLFNFGVHENHIFMLLPTLYLISRIEKIRSVYRMVTLALSTILFLAYGFGSNSLVPDGISSSHPTIFTIAMGFCFVLFVAAFLRTVRINPSFTANNS